MSIARRGGHSARRRAFWLAAAIAVLATVSVAAGGAGAAFSSAKPNKATSYLQLRGKSHGGVVDVSRYLGRNSRVPVQVGANKFEPMKTVVKQARTLQLKQAKLRKTLKRLHRATGIRTFAASPAIGTTRTWLALDDSLGFYRKQFTLRGVGAHSEVWVATPVPRTVGPWTAVGTDFQAGDCRNGTRTTITDAQVNYLIGEFDNNILPKESVEFSVAPDRDGTNQTPLPPLGGVPSDS
jgi:hypothetical protein